MPVQLSQQPTPFGHASTHEYTHFQPGGQSPGCLHGFPVAVTSTHCTLPFTSKKQKQRPVSCGSQTGPT